MFLRNACAILAIIVLWFILLAHIGYRENNGHEKRKNLVIIHNKPQKDNLLKTIFFKFPLRLGADIANANPNKFRYQGCIIFEGMQGSGKTSSMVKQAREYLKEYPMCRLASNIAIRGQDTQIKNGTDILKTNNDIYGYVICIDEIQQFWNSKNSLNLDASITGFITTMRKQKRVLMGTCQSFYMLSKDIRTQTSELRSVKCILGCFNIVICKRPIFDSSGEIKKMKFKRIYCFVQDEELRNAYDTDEIVKALSKNGLKERKERETA